MSEKVSGQPDSGLQSDIKEVQREREKDYNEYCAPKSGGGKTPSKKTYGAGMD